MKKINVLLVSTMFILENIFFITNKTEASLNVKDFLAEVGFYSGIAGTILGTIAGIYKIIKGCYKNCCVKQNQNSNDALSNSDEPETQYTDSNFDDTYTDQNDRKNNINQKLSKDKNSSGIFSKRSNTLPSKMTTINNDI